MWPTDQQTCPTSSRAPADAPGTDAQTARRRAACDECRIKKLKCSGEQPRCSRCVRENITCFYSVQKQMGRPKKRTRTDTDDELDRIPASVGNGTEENRESTAKEAFDNIGMDSLESAFTPGGSLQPWLQSESEWGEDFPLPEGRPPALTPDNSSSHSPPTLDFPHELHHPLESGAPQLESSIQLVVDPALTDPISHGISSTSLANTLSPALMPNCACLSTMYLTLNTLQSPAANEFPFALYPLREAMQTASNVLRCEECPTRFITGLQNTQLVGTLLLSITERYSKVLEHITADSIRAEAAGEKRKFRLADLNTANSHLHTGGLGCLAAFSLHLSPTEWRSMCKKVVRAEVHGPEEGNDCCVYLMGVIQQMQERQDRWHKTSGPVDYPRNYAQGGEPFVGRGGHVKEEDRLCLKMVHWAKLLAEGFDWS